MLWSDFVCCCSFPMADGSSGVVVGGKLPIPPAAKRPIKVCRAAARAAAFAFAGSVVLWWTTCGGGIEGCRCFRIALGASL